MSVLSICHFQSECKLDVNWQWHECIVNLPFSERVQTFHELVTAWVYCQFAIFRASADFTLIGNGMGVLPIFHFWSENGDFT